MMPLGNILLNSIVVLSSGDAESTFVDSSTTTLALKKVLKAATGFLNNNNNHQANRQRPAIGSKRRNGRSVDTSVDIRVKKNKKK